MDPCCKIAIRNVNANSCDSSAKILSRVKVMLAFYRRRVTILLTFCFAYRFVGHLRHVLCNVANDVTAGCVRNVVAGVVTRSSLQYLSY